MVGQHCGAKFHELINRNKFILCNSPIVLGKIDLPRYLLCYDLAPVLPFSATRNQDKRKKYS